MTNEVEICRLLNIVSVTQKELDQKEKLTIELNEKVQSTEQADVIQHAADLKIGEKQKFVEVLNNQLYEKDKQIEQLEKLLRAKEAQKQEMIYNKFKLFDNDEDQQI